MVQLLEHLSGPRELRAPAAPAVADEAAARRSLRAQVVRLEAELGDCFVTAFQQRGVRAPAPARSPRPAAPHLLSLGELEALRDALSARLGDGRTALAERTAREEQARILLERMLLEPGRHRFVRVAAADLGERGCGVWHVRPRLGLIGMLMGWWQVKLSSGCPLPEAG
jgi:hypothetical protein